MGFSALERTSCTVTPDCAKRGGRAEGREEGLPGRKTHHRLYETHGLLLIPGVVVRGRGNTERVRGVGQGDHHVFIRECGGVVHRRPEPCRTQPRQLHGPRVHHPARRRSLRAAAGFPPTPLRRRALGLRRRRTLERGSRLAPTADSNRKKVELLLSGIENAKATFAVVASPPLHTSRRGPPAGGTPRANAPRGDAVPRLRLRLVAPREANPAPSDRFRSLGTLRA